MSPPARVQALLARRPHGPGVPAFGHVDLDAQSREQLDEVVSALVANVRGKTAVEFHPDDLAADGEVLVAPLTDFDQNFQAQAPWSLERAVSELRSAGLPTTLTEGGIVEGEWSFYVLGSQVGNSDAIAIRAKSPSWGLKAGSRILTKVVGQELKLVEEPLIAFDRRAEAVVIDDQVYVLEPRQLERLLIDAEAVKGRAAATTRAFKDALDAQLATKTVSAIEKVCSNNANVARRVERLIRDGGLARVTAAEVRSALPDANLGPEDFGKSGALHAVTDSHATILIDIAADLYYQPRFQDGPRRVAAYRRVR